VWLGTPPELDADLATLYPYGMSTVLRRLVPEALMRDSHEGRVLRQLMWLRRSLVGRAFLNPWMGGMEVLDRPEVRRLELPWVNGAFSARGLATLYAGLATGGSHGGVRLLSPAMVDSLASCQSWSDHDRVMQKPMGFSLGFAKEQLGVYASTGSAFGHQGTGGSVGLADPSTGVAIGYVMNRLDWRQRSPRAVVLCRAVYETIGQPFPERPSTPARAGRSKVL
jgi:CubicO group peptidase (beta-lactamase class C family)